MGLPASASARSDSGNFSATQRALLEPSPFEQRLHSFLNHSACKGTELRASNTSSMTDCRITYNRWNSLLLQIYQSSGIELELAQDTSELLCRCLINAETLGKALKLAERFTARNPVAQLHFSGCGNTVNICLYNCATSHAIEVLQLASHLKLLSWLIGETIPVLRMNILSTLGDESSSEVERLFNCSVSTRSEQTALTIDQFWLKRPVVQTYADLRFVLGLPALALIPWPPTSLLKTRTAQLIAKAISRHGQAPTLDEVAIQLGRGSSSLRRQLLREGTSFQAIKDAWRKERAEHLLQDSKNSLDDIAGQLGFESTSVFSRAFKAWTGTAPSIFRLGQKRS